MTVRLVPALPRIRGTALLLSLLALTGVCGCATAPRMQTLAPVPAAQPQAAWHTVARGETLWRIARNYGIGLNELMAANHITDASHVPSGTRIMIPMHTAAPLAAYPSDVASIVGAPRCRVAWQTITLHHSATSSGNAAVFDRWHRKKGMGGLFYHFLIGNGSGLGDGQIEVGYRWKDQCEVNRPKDIQICLVGNFCRQQVSPRQFDSLIQLLTVLCRQYHIGPGSVRTHKAAAAKPSECPGTNFPFDRIIRELRHNL